MSLAQCMNLDLSTQFSTGLQATLPLEGVRPHCPRVFAAPSKKRLLGAHAGSQNRLSLPLPRDSPRSVNTVMSDKPPPTSFSTDSLQAASAERRPSKEALS